MCPVGVGYPATLAWFITVPNSSQGRVFIRHQRVKISPLLTQNSPANARKLTFWYMTNFYSNESLNQNILL